MNYCWMIHRSCCKQSNTTFTPSMSTRRGRLLGSAISLRLFGARMGQVITRPNIRGRIKKSTSDVSFGLRMQPLLCNFCFEMQAAQALREWDVVRAPKPCPLGPGECHLLLLVQHMTHPIQHICDHLCLVYRDPIVV